MPLRLLEFVVELSDQALKARLVDLPPLNRLTAAPISVSMAAVTLLPSFERCPKVTDLTEAPNLASSPVRTTSSRPSRGRNTFIACSQSLSTAALLDEQTRTFPGESLSR